MKRLSFAIIFACMALALMADDAIRVNFKGSQPTITDFAWAFCKYFHDLEETGDKPSNAILDALECVRDNKPLDATLTIQDKNGYLFYERKYDNVVFQLEMCVWNEADGKHKLFVFNHMLTLVDGKPACTETSGLMFYRYNKATKKMVYVDAPGFEVDYMDTTYSMPCYGKDITVTKWHADGTKTVSTLEWDGHKFSNR